MKVLLITVLLAVAATAAVADVASNLATAAEVLETETNTKTNEYSKTNDEDGEKDHGDSDESSSEEHDGENNEELEEDNENTKVAVKTCSGATTFKPVAMTKSTYRPNTQPSAYVKPAYEKPAYIPSTNYKKPTYEQVTAPIDRPVVTTEAPKPMAVYNIDYAKPEGPASIEAPPKYVKPSTAATVNEATTAKYVPISFEKPVATPVVTIRKSGWVRAPGYKLGYARAESSNPAVIEVPKYTPPAKKSEPIAVVMTTKTDEKPSAPRQTYPKWFFKTKSAGN